MRMKMKMKMKKDEKRENHKRQVYSDTENEISKLKKIQKKTRFIHD